MLIIFKLTCKISIYRHIFSNSIMEFYEEALSLTCDLTTTKISDNMWEVLADIYNVFERDGLDYFTDMMPALHNYVTVSQINVFCSWETKNRKILTL